MEQEASEARECMSSQLFDRAHGVGLRAFVHCCLGYVGGKKRATYLGFLSSAFIVLGPAFSFSVARTGKVGRSHVSLPRG